MSFSAHLVMESSMNVLNNNTDKNEDDNNDDASHFDCLLNKLRRISLMAKECGVRF